MSASAFAREPFELQGARGLPLRGEALVPERVAGTDASVVVCHGFKGFARFSFFPYLAERLAGAGMRVVSFTFSGSGVGEDGETFSEADAFHHNTYTRELEDVDRVVTEAGRRGWVDDHYGLFGHSRGGGIAVLRAARDPHVGALVTWAAISTVNRWTAEERRAWRDRGSMDVPNARTGRVLTLGTDTLDEIERLGASELDIGAAARDVRAPWLLVHGTDDETVSVEEGRRLAQAALAGTVRSEFVQGLTHAFGSKHPMTTPSPELRRVVELTSAFFLEHLGPGA